MPETYEHIARIQEGTVGQGRAEFFDDLGHANSIDHPTEEREPPAAWRSVTPTSGRLAWCRRTAHGGGDVRPTGNP